MFSYLSGENQFIEYQLLEKYFKRIILIKLIIRPDKINYPISNDDSRNSFNVVSRNYGSNKLIYSKSLVLTPPNIKRNIATMFAIIELKRYSIKQFFKLSQLT